MIFTGPKHRAIFWGRKMESTTINYCSLRLDVDYYVLDDGNDVMIQSITCEGIELSGFIEGMFVEGRAMNGSKVYNSAFDEIEEMILQELANERGPAEFEGWRVGQ